MEETTGKEEELQKFLGKVDEIGKESLFRRLWLHLQEIENVRALTEGPEFETSQELKSTAWVSICFRPKLLRLICYLYRICTLYL